MVILLKTASVRVSSIQIIQVRVQNKGKSVWKSRYDGDVSTDYCQDDTGASQAVEEEVTTISSDSEPLPRQKFQRLLGI